ncbi:MAG: Hsp20/alpha crystallin family protein [Halobacteriales archaeon]|nr:Hsp20/alpha crystallin family protein [Halobacteriales archaeon]
MRYTPFETMERMMEQLRRDMWEFQNSWNDEWTERRMRMPMSERRMLSDDSESDSPREHEHKHDRGFDMDRRGFNMDLTEHDDEFVFTADVPGFEKDEIDLRIDGHQLLLSATHEETDDSSTRSRSVHERISLRKDVVEDEITATYKNGVLEVHLPFEADAEETGHDIEIN